MCALFREHLLFELHHKWWGLDREDPCQRDAILNVSDTPLARDSQTRSPYLLECVRRTKKSNFQKLGQEKRTIFLKHLKWKHPQSCKKNENSSLGSRMILCLSNSHLPSFARRARISWQGFSAGVAFAWV